MGTNTGQTIRPWKFIATRKKITNADKEDRQAEATPLAAAITRSDPLAPQSGPVTPSFKLLLYCNTPRRILE